MKYYENNSYVNHGAIPSNEYAKNKDDRTLEIKIETERIQTVDDEVIRQLNRSLWMLEKKRNTGSKSSVNGFGFGWRANGSSMDMLLQFGYNEPTTYHSELSLAY